MWLGCSTNLEAHMGGGEFGVFVEAVRLLPLAAWRLASGQPAILLKQRSPGNASSMTCGVRLRPTSRSDSVALLSPLAALRTTEDRASTSTSFSASAYLNLSSRARVKTATSPPRRSSPRRGDTPPRSLPPPRDVSETVFLQRQRGLEEAKAPSSSPAVSATHSRRIYINYK